MTTLQSYLSSGAVEDVRDMISDGASRHIREIDRQKFRLYRDVPAPNAPAWMVINIATRHGDILQSARCYYRETSPGHFIVSDCGETVSEVMRRTGKDFWECVDWCDDMTDGSMGACYPAIQYEMADLPAAIVSVLGAVAKVRSALDKDGGQ